jgi:long-chain acyl-CoA synthetase
MSDPTPSIPEALRQALARHGDQPAILFPDRSVSLAEVDAASDRVAAALADAGIVKGDRVALYCINSDSFAFAYLGIQKAGAVVVPVNLLFNPKEIDYILNDAGVRGLIYHTAMGESVKAFAPQVSSLQFACCIAGEPVVDDHQHFADWLAGQGEAPLVSFDTHADLAAILYTSGTTGHPKGAMLTHRNLVSNTNSVAEALQLEPGRDRMLVVLPMFHSFAATVGLLTPLLHGLALAPVAKFEPGLVSDVIGAVGATVFLGVPSMYNVLLRLPDEQATKWATVRFGVSGGAAMPVELMRRFEARFGFPILEGDGPTECSPVTCVNPLHGERKPASVGLPVPNVEMAIFDDAGARLPTGEIGEICVRGPNVMQGYWHLPEATAESFFGDWVRTGDLGYIDADGYVFMVDRKKDMIIVNGMNVYPRMVEEVLFRHPDIAEAAVVGEPHASHGEIVVAHLVPREGAVLDAAAVKAWCRDNLGRHEQPRKVILRDALPKNATGKVLKRELRTQGELERGVDSR